MNGQKKPNSIGDKINPVLREDFVFIHSCIHLKKKKDTVTGKHREERPNRVWGERQQSFPRGEGSPSPLFPQLSERSDSVARFMSPLPPVFSNSKAKRSA